MPFLAIAALAAITYTFRIAGPLLAGRVTVPDSAQRLFASAAAVLLVALAATSALTTGHDFAGWARPAGVLVAGVLAARRLPFPIVVLAAASVTALLRLAGIHLSRTAGADSRSGPPSSQVRFARFIPTVGRVQHRILKSVDRNGPQRGHFYPLSSKTASKPLRPVTSGTGDEADTRCSLGRRIRADSGRRPAGSPPKSEFPWLL